MSERRTAALGGGVALLAAALTCGFVGLHTQPGYDAAYSIAWGQDIAAGHGIDYSQPSAPTPHPLVLLGRIATGFLPTHSAILVGGICSALFGAVLILVLCKVTWELTTSPLATATTAVIVATSAPVGLLVLEQSIDIPYAALATAGVLFTLRKHNTAAIATFMTAALLRPEALVLAVIPLVAAVRAHHQAGDQPAARRAGVWYCGQVVAVVGIWLALGAAGGDPLVALHSAARNAALNNDPRGPVTALTSVLPDLAQPLGWTTLVLACIVLATAVLRLRKRPTPRPTARKPTPATPALEVSTFGAGPVLTVGAFVGLAVVAFIAQGLTGTPLIARYLLLPALACAPLAATLVRLAEGLSPRRAVKATLTWTTATVLVATSAGSNVAAWHDLSSTRATRQDLFAAADDLLRTDLPRACPGVFVVRSPAMIPVVALSLGRPLEDLRVAGNAAGGVLLQPLTIDAAALAGYGPMTALEDQGHFPADASPRTSNTHWALYSNCTTTG